MMVYLFLLRLCLVPMKYKNAKYQLLWNDEMQNAKIFMGVFSFIQNAKFFMRWVRFFLVFDSFFFCLLRPKSKIENGYLFTKNFARCLVSFCKMMSQNLKFFRWNGKVNTPLVGARFYMICNLLGHSRILKVAQKPTYRLYFLLGFLGPSFPVLQTMRVASDRQLGGSNW
jgi:hypothetical protein